MRKILAILLAGLFLILLMTAVTLNQVVDTASQPDVIIGMLNDADAYDYVYDEIIANLVRDIVENGFEVNSGLSGSSAPSVLKFDDPDAASVAILGLLETLIPREYVKGKLEEGLQGLVPYLTGKTDEFSIDLETQDRVRAVPGAVRALVTDLKLTEQVVEDLLVPQISEFSSKISGDALGINFTQQEIEETTLAVFAPEWLEGQLFGAIDEVIPYFAGDADSFNVVLQVDDRVVIIGGILKDKLAREDILYNLVFARVIDPLIQQTVSQSTSVGFGISLTEQEVVDAFEVIAPRQWVRDQGSGVIDALIDYMVGNADELVYTVDLADRKTAAASELQQLARKKLRAVLGAIPSCGSTADALAAAQDVATGQIPRCIAGGQTTIDLAFQSFGPILDAQVGSFVDTQVPSQLSYSLADFESQVGGGIDTVENIRTRVIEGVNFSDQDLINLLAQENNPESRADAETLLQILAAGVVITEENITGSLNASTLQQLDSVRGYVNQGLTVRWLLWIVVLIPLVSISFIGGRGWAGRLKWAGAVAAVSGLIIYAAITAGWSFADVGKDYFSDFTADRSAGLAASYPRLAVELASDEPGERIQRALDSWQAGWRNQTIPWIIAGMVAFVVGSVLGLKRTKKWAPLHKSTGPSPAAMKAARADVLIADAVSGLDEPDASDGPDESDEPDGPDEPNESDGPDHNNGNGDEPDVEAGPKTSTFQV